MNHDGGSKYFARRHCCHHQPTQPQKELAGKNDAPRQPPIEIDFRRIEGGHARAMGSPPGGVYDIKSQSGSDRHV